MYEHPELRFSDYAGPRIKGLISFYHFDNTRVLSHFSRIGKALNRAGIPILLFKGAAIKVLKPELSRPMADVDIFVPPGRFAQAMDICEKLGYRKESSSKYSGDLLDQDGKAMVDIHCRLFHYIKDGGEALDGPFSRRARPVEVFGVTLLMPAREDLFTILLLNLEKNLREWSSLHSLYFTLWDCRLLLSGGFDWNIVRENARLINCGYQIRFAAAFMNTLVPGIVPQDMIEKHFPWTRRMEQNWERKMAKVQNRSVMERVIDQRAAACRRILLVDLKRRPRRILSMVVKLFLFRKLRDLPAFVRWYLESHGYEVYRAD
jgi:hypothetical protein